MTSVRGSRRLLTLAWVLAGPAALGCVGSVDMSPPPGNSGNNGNGTGSGNAGGSGSSGGGTLPG
ncbi:MAG TPA: hypothetical protein VGG33_28855, partial [Polyangia bacterium]